MSVILHNDHIFTLRAGTENSSQGETTLLSMQLQLFLQIFLCHFSCYPHGGMEIIFALGLS